MFCPELPGSQSEKGNRLGWGGKRKDNHNNGQNLLSAHSVPGIKSFMCGSDITK